jgi:hypothetical protein
MTRTTKSEPEAPAEPVEPLPELNPWRTVGWIFRDGACVAIERRGAELRSGTSVD